MGILLLKLPSRDLTHDNLSSHTCKKHCASTPTSVLVARLDLRSLGFIINMQAVERGVSLLTSTPFMEWKRIAHLAIFWERLLSRDLLGKIEVARDLEYTRVVACLDLDRTKF